MKSCDLSPLVAVLFIIIALCTLFTGCTSLQNIAQPPISAPVSTPNVTAPVITATVTTGPPIQTLPAGPLRTQASDTGFLVAINASQSKVLDLINSINTELAKDSTLGNTSPDYTALGSYARRLFATTDEEINAMSKFREISDPAYESRKDYYTNYLTRLKPFAANLETGAALAQKKEFKTASGFFSNAKNDLALVRSQELAGHLKVIAQINENFEPFIDAVQQQGTTPDMR
ncbi:MAG: hypothetical protein WCK53_08415 [Methanomicrobiales archaeon]